MSEEQLASNPFVMRLMERIAALEERQRPIPIEVEAVLFAAVEGDAVESTIVVVHTIGMDVSCYVLFMYTTIAIYENWIITWYYKYQL